MSQSAAWTGERTTTSRPAGAGRPRRRRRSRPTAPRGTRSGRDPRARRGRSSSPAWTSRSIGRPSGRSRRPRTLSTGAPRRSAAGRFSGRPAVTSCVRRRSSGRTSSRGVQAPRPRLATVSPERMTVMRSPISSISSMRWVMKITPTPSAASRATSANSRSRVATSSAEVASSRIRIRGVAQQRAHDAAGLPVAEREVLDRPWTGRPAGRGAPRSAALARRRFSRAGTLRPPGVVGAEPDVVQHRAGLGDEDLLEDRDDAVLLRGSGAAQLDLGPVDLDRARVGRVHAAEDLHQRALARAVLADQRVDLARAQLERAVPERLGGRRTPSPRAPRGPGHRGRSAHRARR